MTLEPAWLRTLHSIASRRGNGDVDAGLAQVLGEHLVSDYPQGRWSLVRDHVLFPKAQAVLECCEDAPAEILNRRAAHVAINATFHAQDIVDDRAERRRAAQDFWKGGGKRCAA